MYDWALAGPDDTEEITRLFGSRWTHRWLARNCLMDPVRVLGYLVDKATRMYTVRRDGVLLAVAMVEQEDFDDEDSCSPFYTLHGICTMRALPELDLITLEACSRLLSDGALSVKLPVLQRTYDPLHRRWDNVGRVYRWPCALRIKGSDSAPFEAHAYLRVIKTRDHATIQRILMAAEKGTLHGLVKKTKSAYTAQDAGPLQLLKRCWEYAVSTWHRVSNVHPV